MRQKFGILVLITAIAGLVSGAALAQEPEPSSSDEGASEDIEILHEMDREVAEDLMNAELFEPPPNGESLQTETMAGSSGKYLPLFERTLLFAADGDRSFLVQRKVHPKTRLELELAKFDFPIVINVQVQSWLEFFTSRARRYFKRYLERAARYVPLMKPVFERYGLPTDLVYLAMIESGFSLRARSWAGAVGPWQFMRSTARLCGLRVDRTVDERRDFERATEAAAKHLKDLFERFGDWYLALAAYNAGPLRIKRAIERYGTHNYWELSQYDYLALETKLYVPKFIAALIIAKQPERFGFFDLTPEPPLEFDTVELKGPASLYAIARAANATEDELQELNPAFVRGFIPADGKTYRIRLPKGSREQFLVAWQNLSPTDKVARAEPELLATQRKRSSKGSKTKYKLPGKVIAEVYTVRFGDTLFGIAKRFGTTVERILELNRITDKNRIHPGQKLIVERFVRDTRYTLNEEGKPVLRKARPRKGKPDPFSGSRLGRKVHILKPGETLWHLSIKYGVPVRKLMKLNHIRNPSRLRPGQRIIIRR